MKEEKLEIEKKQNQKKAFDTKPPTYSSDGCAAWVNQDKNGNDYLTIKIVGHNTINAFKNVKPTEKK